MTARGLESGGNTRQETWEYGREKEEDEKAGGRRGLCSGAGWSMRGFTDPVCALSLSIPLSRASRFHFLGIDYFGNLGGRKELQRRVV